MKRRTNETEQSVVAFVESIEGASTRDDCRTITQLMIAATGVEPKMRGIGFGKHHYQYANSIRR